MPQHQISLTSPTGHLKLIPPNGGDDEAVAVLRTHSITRRYLQFLPERFSADDARIRREKLAEDERWMSFHAHLQNGDGTTTFVGMTGLYDIDLVHDSCTIGILISPEYHRGGIATEVLYTLLKFVFEDMKMHRAKFETGADNVMMSGWLEHVLGAQQEYRVRECWKDGPGTYTDAVVYAILEWEWTSTMKARMEQSLKTTIVQN